MIISYDYMYYPFIGETQHDKSDRDRSFRMGKIWRVYSRKTKSTVSSYDLGVKLEVRRVVRGRC